MSAGQLYIVATPIGNLSDITYRAVEVLRDVAVIAAEDTRHSARLLQHYQIDTPCIALHEHNEQQQAEQLMARLKKGEDIACVSDAGTPLISDPGYRLVQVAIAHGINVVPVPGASALIAALSVAGLATDAFAFQGFLPPKKQSRENALQACQLDPRTLIFYEAPHRILAMLTSIQAVFGDDRQVVVARELTKLHETFYRGTIIEVLSQMRGDANAEKGEFVVLVQGKKHQGDISPEQLRIIRLLADELPAKQAAKLAASITGLSRNMCYKP